MSMGPVIMDPLSFLILIISVFFFVLIWLELYQFCCFKESALDFLAFLYLFQFSISLISVPVFIIYLFMLTLDLICSFFSSFLRWKFRLFTLYLSHFLIYAFNALYFPISLIPQAFICYILILI